MSDERKIVVTASHPAGLGLLWFGGWLFCIGYVPLGVGKAILGLVLWPYYLGVLVH
jgi:hypothetical protein